MGEVKYQTKQNLSQHFVVYKTFYVFLGFNILLQFLLRKNKELIFLLSVIILRSVFEYLFKLRKKSTVAKVNSQHIALHPMLEMLDSHKLYFFKALKNTCAVNYCI